MQKITKATQESSRLVSETPADVRMKMKSTGH